MTSDPLLWERMMAERSEAERLDKLFGQYEQDSVMQDLQMLYCSIDPRNLLARSTVVRLAQRIDKLTPFARCAMPYDEEAPF